MVTQEELNVLGAIIGIIIGAVTQLKWKWVDKIVKVLER